jgi:hypothetical protein
VKSATDDVRVVRYTLLYSTWGTALSCSGAEWGLDVSDVSQVDTLQWGASGDLGFYDPRYPLDLTLCALDAAGNAAGLKVCPKIG